MKKDNSKKLTLNAAIVRTLQTDLTVDQLKKVAGGAGSATTREGVC